MIPELPAARGGGPGHAPPQEKGRQASPRSEVVRSPPGISLAEQCGCFCIVLMSRPGRWGRRSTLRDILPEGGCMKSALKHLPLGFLLLLLLPLSSAFAADATVRLLGEFRSGTPRTCFRIKPVNGSFDVRNVTLSSIQLLFHGASLSPPDGSARLQFDCEREDSLGEGDGEGDHGGCDSTGHHDDAARLRLDGGFPGDDEGDSTDTGCDDCNADSCQAVAIRVC